MEESVDIIENIRKISYDSAELFLSANGKIVPVLTDKLYKKVEEMLEEYDDELYYPDEIINWRIACELTLSPLNIKKQEAKHVLSASFGDLMIIAQQLKLGQIEREQILDVLKFLNLIDDITPYIEELDVNIYKHLFDYLDHLDVINLCESSKKIKTLISSTNGRSILFPELKDNMIIGKYNSQEFYDYFTNYLSFRKHKNNNIVFNKSGFYRLENDLIAFYNWNYEKKTISLNYTGKIEQIVCINHIIYALMNDGIIITKNLLTTEETFSIELNDCIYISSHDQDLIIVVSKGYCFVWNGYLRRIHGTKYITQVVKHNKNRKLLLSCNGKIYVTDENYSNYKVIDSFVNVTQISKSGYYCLSSRGFVYKITDSVISRDFDFVEIVKIIDHDKTSYFIDRTGKIFGWAFNMRRRPNAPIPILNKFDDVFCTNDRLYYVSKGKLYYLFISQVSDDTKSHYAVTL